MAWRRIKIRCACIAATCLISAFQLPATAGESPKATPPYPHSTVIDRIVWEWNTRKTAAPGSDLWPITWAADGSLFTAWGDGGGFGGTDQDGRVSLGFARIDGPPDQFVGTNLNGGMNPRHPASFPKKGKVGGVLAVGRRVYAWLNTQNGKWPDVDQALIWSDDDGATWQRADWIFAKGDGRLKPSTFLNFGKGYTDVPEALGGYVYFYGQKQGDQRETFLGRVPPDKLPDRAAYEFCYELGGRGPLWSADVTEAAPIFVDRSGDLAGVVYVPGLKRHLLTAFHTGPGQLGVFDSANPWGPWTTVAYEEHWGEMGSEGEGLTCSFPAKWMSADGKTLWCVFSAYGGTAKQGIDAHDKFNLVKATIELKH
jgi:hypothetical protein